jgi:hypothetical protein
MPLLGLTVGIDLNGFLDSETQLTRVRAEKRGSKAVGSGGGNFSTVTLQCRKDIYDIGRFRRNFSH